jgi:hypothetical protein
VVAAVIAAALSYMIAMPGEPHAGPLPPLSGEQRALSLRLRLHVAALAANERYSDLETPARYIESALAKQGFTPQSQYFESEGRRMRNIEAGAGAIVVGAHYDTVPGSPGADDNASAVAVLIELAALLKNESIPVRFVAFANEEVLHSRGETMGSYAWAKRARERGEPIRAMFSLEMLGYYRDAPGSQRYPFPLDLFYPDRADFIAFVGDLGARDLVRKSIGLFRKNPFPSQGVAAPGFVPGVTWSDHASFRRHGYDAIMITDTAFNRNPHYHRPSDTPDTLDYERMARLTLGLAAMLKELAHEDR